MANMQQIHQNNGGQSVKELLENTACTTDDPIEKAVIGNIMGTLPAKKPAEVQVCSLCNLEFHSAVVMNAHLAGKRHAKTLKNKSAQGIELSLCGDAISTDDKKDILRTEFECKVCNIFANSAGQLESHLKSNKHLQRLAKQNPDNPEAVLSPNEVQRVMAKKNKSSHSGDNSASPPAKKGKTDPSLFTCTICNCVMNSQAQYDQHILSKKHKNKVNPPPIPMSFGNSAGGHTSNKKRKFNDYMTKKSRARQGLGYNNPIESTFVKEASDYQMLSPFLSYKSKTCGAAPQAFASFGKCTGNLSGKSNEYAQLLYRSQALQLVKQADLLMSQAKQLDNTLTPLTKGKPDNSYMDNCFQPPQSGSTSYLRASSLSSTDRSLGSNTALKDNSNKFSYGYGNSNDGGNNWFNNNSYMAAGMGCNFGGSNYQAPNTPKNPPFKNFQNNYSNNKSW